MKTENKRCVLIRHGLTDGNIQKRYVGQKTNEGLSTEGMEKLKNEVSKLPKIDLKSKLFVSPMKRCIQSAEMLFPDMTYEIVENLKEIDFGDFESKTYQELSDNTEYVRWIESNGTLPFPNGESRDEFIKRNVAAFKSMLYENDETDELVFVIHGGSIMAIMSELTGEDYFSFQTGCGDGYELNCRAEEGKIDVLSYNRLFDRGDS